MAKDKNKTRDISNRGWSEWDFKYPASVRGVTAATFGIYPTSQGLATAQQTLMPTTQAQASTQLGMPGPGINPATANVPSRTPGSTGGAVTQMPSSTFVSRAEQQPVRDYLNDPSAISVDSPLDTAKSWLSNLFDTEDVKETAVENVWDGFLTGVNWGYDRLNQVTSAGISGLPGGIPTLTWEQAGDVSVGQAFVGSMGAAAGRFKRGELETSDYLTLPGVLVSSAFSMIDTDNAAQQAGFKITDKQQREAAFGGGAGMIASGTLDTAFTIFADPLIFGGKVLKVARLRYLDRPIDSPERIAELTNNLNMGGVTVVGGDPTQIRNMAPEAQFAYWATRKNEDGTKVLTTEEIYNHRVIRAAANREGLTAALYNAENYDEAALVIRAAYSDPAAQVALLEKRADLALELGDAQRKLNMAKFANNPDVKRRLERQAEKKANAANSRYATLRDEFNAMDDLDPNKAVIGARMRRALAERNAANDTYAFTSKLDESMIDPLNPLNFTADSAATARRAMDEMIRRDRYFMRALGQEQTRVSSPIFGTLAESTRGFSRNNRFGRSVERLRENRATAAYEAAATRGARVIDETGKARRLHFWESDVFGNNGLTRSLRLWRWFGEETPSGFITTRGIGSQESAREIRAAVNDIPIYSGESKTVTITKERRDKSGKFVPVIDKATGQPMTETIQVGGVARKEELVTRYINALNDSTRGDMAAKFALDSIEEEISRDIAAWHGMSRNTAQDVLLTAQGKREELIESIRKEGYWIEPGETTPNKSPWLETQLQQGTYMLNFKKFEERARLFDESGITKKADEARQFAQEKAGNAYEFFNEVWRPAVLMRLGYTQRNVAEGLIRASAFQFSLAPIQYAVWQGAYSLRNAWVRRNFGGWSGTQGAMEQATEALRISQKTGTPVVFPKKFVKWRATQVVAEDKRIAENLTTIGEVGKVVASSSVVAHRELTDFFVRQANEALDDVAAIRARGGTADEIAVAEGRLEVMNKYIDEFNAIKPQDSMTRELFGSLENLRLFMQSDEYFRAQRDILDNELESVALFRQQATAKRRVFDGSYSGPDHLTYRQAFDKDSPFSPIALMMLSADNTQKAMASLRMDAMGNALRAVQTKYYVAVNPDQGDVYYDGVSNALRQFKFSEVGNMVINGAEPDEIVRFLQNTREGRDIISFVTNAEIPKNGKTRMKPDFASTQQYVDMLFRRYEQLAPSPELREYMKTANVGAALDDKSGFTGQVVKTFLDQKNPDGSMKYNLQPVVGNIAAETGYSSVRQLWAKFANTGMKWLGTFPEDAFVRVPFYGARYDAYMKSSIALLKEQTPGNYVSIKEIEALQRQAHRRALKDTKDTLYTIDRRTRLGNVGEYMFPFISAFQNSVTAMGRIVWNDPSIAAIGLALWNAPNKMGIEDNEGNIVIPIPHEFLPDGVEQALGLDNMRNIKINKGQLNVVMPESGFGIIPRPGPLVVAPVSEIMKHGFFGISVESPEILRGALGKEKADQVWNLWKDYTFGENQGISPDPLSLTLFTPPVAAKVVQMIQGEGSSRQYAYYYNLQMRNEIAQYVAGYRDTMPSADEIKERTNGFYLARIMANLFAFTPPQYESNLDPLTNAIRAYDQQYGIDGARMANQAFGNLLLMLGDWSNSKNVAGMMPFANSVEAARKYADIIKSVAPGLSESGNLSVLSMLVSDDPNAYYDGSAYAWQFSEQIPGVTDYFREMQTPEQAFAESTKNAGWVEFISRMDYLDALLQQRGLTSYRSAGAEDLREMKAQTIADMRDNPLYSGWFQDYEQFGSTRTQSAVRLMEQALSDQQFVDDHEDSPIWQAASLYLQHRAMVLEELSKREGTINNEKNQYIREYWDTQRQFLINKFDGWGTFANRFLNGDDDPKNTGVQFGAVYEVTTGGTQ